MDDYKGVIKLAQNSRQRKVVNKEGKKSGQKK